MSNFQFMILLAAILGQGVALGKLIWGLQGNMSAMENLLSYVEELLEEILCIWRAYVLSTPREPNNSG